jgi:hypothetical protein
VHRDELVAAIGVYQCVNGLIFLALVGAPDSLIRAWLFFTMAVISLHTLVRQQRMVFL